MPKGVYKRTQKCKRILSLAKLKYYALKNILTKEFLIKEYIKNKKSTYKIDKLVVCSQPSISNYLKKYNVKVRNYSESKIGIFPSKETRKKMSLSYDKNRRDYKMIGMKISKKLTGKKLTKEHRKNISLGHGGTGIPYENYKYPKKFYKIRNEIRERDNYTCQICGMTEEEQLIVVGYELTVHHIDYNVQNNKENNLSTLCIACHIKTNFDREYWEEFFKTKEITSCLSGV